MAYTFLDFAYSVLSQSEKPLTFHEIWQKGIELRLDSKLNTSGKTPWRSIGARLFVNVRDNSDSKFMKVGNRPARFFLSSRRNEVSKELINQIHNEELKSPIAKESYHERELHPLITYFAYANPSFEHGKTIFTKTIYHEKSKKKGFNEWLYPDLVGFYLPIEDWDNTLIELNRISDNNAFKLFSFELKKSLNKGNYRESYFQAVSNSSWANEGYLVAANIQKDDDLLSELERLSTAFGIGIIELDLDDIDSSKVLYPAKVKSYLDWETMNKLCEKNPDFNKFMQDVKIDLESKRIHQSEYDKIINDPEGYINTIRK